MSEILVQSAPQREMADNDGPGAADNSSLTPLSASASASAPLYLHVPYTASPYPSNSPSLSPANIPLPPSSSPVPGRAAGGRSGDELQAEDAEPGVSRHPAASGDAPSSSPAGSDHHRVVDVRGLHGTHVTLQTVEMVDPLAGLDDDDDDKEDVGVVRVDDGEEPQPASQRFAAARAISSTLPLSLPSAEEEEEEKEEKFSTHRPLPILTSGPAFQSAIPPRAASSLAAFPSSHLAPIPVPAAQLGDDQQLQLGAAPAVSTEEEKAQYETLSLHELRTPISGGGDDAKAAAAATVVQQQQPGGREAEDEWGDAAYDDDVKTSALPPLTAAAAAAAASAIASLNISYGTAAPELLPAVANGYEYDDSADSVGAALGSSERESLSGTTVPYAGTASAPYGGMSDTYIPAPVGDHQVTYVGSDLQSAALATAAAAGYTMSLPPPYTERPTALSPEEPHPLSPQSHLTGKEAMQVQSTALLRPGSAQSSAPLTPLSAARRDDDYKATASSVTSYSDAPLRRAVSPYDAEPRLLTRRASYEYTAADAADDAAIQEMLERGEGQGEGGTGELTSEEKEPGLPAEALAEGVPSVAELENGIYPGEGAAQVDDIELMRASSALAEQWRREDAAVVAAALVQADAALAKELNDDVNRHREGQSAAASPGVRPRGASGRSRRSGRRSGSQAKGDIPHWPVFMSLIIAIDVTLLVAMIGYDGWQFAALFDNPMYGPEGSTLLHFGAKFTPALLVHSQGWRLLVSCLLHSGVIHLVFSIGIALMYLSQLEREHGWYRVGLVFITSGIFSQLFSALLNPTYVSVGGGAALIGVVSSWLGDFVHSFHQLQGPWQYFMRNVLSTGIVFAAGVFPFNDNWGSIGGLIAGVLGGLAFYFPLHRSLRTGKWRIHHVRIWVPALVVLLASIGAIAAALYGQSASAAYSQHGNGHWISCVDTPYWSCSAGVPANCFNANGLPAGGNSTYC